MTTDLLLRRNIMKVFLSHSRSDKKIIESVRDTLGPECTWIDTAEIDIGEVIVDKITEGIERCTDFILFWSVNSASSPWVRLELNMALIKSIEQSGCDLRIVRLDSTDLPLYLRPYLYLDVDSDYDRLPKKLTESLKRIKSRTIRRSKFVNRHSELGRIELAVDDPEIRICTLSGISGIGKKAVLQKTTDTLFTGARYVGIDIKPGLDLVAFALLLASTVPIAAPENFSSSEELKKFLQFCLEELHSTGAIIVFHDVQEWIEEDASISPPLQYLFEFASSMDALSSIPFFLTTTRRFEVPMEFSYLHQYINIGDISTEHIITILNNFLRVDLGKTFSSEKLNNIAKMLCGYPLAARLASGLISQYGIEHLESNPVKIVDLKVGIAKHLVGEIPLFEETARLLEVLAIADAPLPAEDFASVLAFTDEQFRNAIEQAVEVGLLKYDEGQLTLHPLVQDYYFRAIYGTGRFKGLTENLASHARERLDSLDVSNPIHYKLMLSVFRIVALSGDLQGALTIREDLIGYLEQVVKDLYDSRQYPKALEYAEQILYHDPKNWEVRFIHARCLIRLNEDTKAEKILQDMLEDPKKDKRILHALGRLEMSRENYDEALNWFSQALTKRPRYVACLRDSAECFVRMGKLTEAEGFLVRAKEIDEKNPFVLQLESRVFEEREEYDKAYEVMSIASKLERNNSYFSHRLGRISELQGELEQAKNHYSDAIKIDDRSIESHLSLASVLIDLRQYDTVPEKLDELADIVTGRAVSVLRGIKAKYLYATDQDLDQAASLVDKNLLSHNDPSNYGLRAQIEIRRSEIKEAKGYSALAKQCLDSALNFVERGLDHYCNNKPLQGIKANIIERLNNNEIDQIQKGTILN